jgi:hypothetical protein
MWRSSAFCDQTVRRAASHAVVCSRRARPSLPSKT